MRNSTAKKIRKQIYGEMSPRIREYKLERHNKTIYKDGKPYTVVTETLINTGLRAKYLKAKASN